MKSEQMNAACLIGVNERIKIKKKTKKNHMKKINKNANRVEKIFEALMLVDGVNTHWTSIAKIHFEEGFMALRQAIDPPNHF